ncbi:MAG: hypothetical protein V4492_07390 [Chlamydiota bacterium]
MTSYSGPCSSKDLRMDDFFMIETCVSFDPKDQNIKPTASPMAILNTNGPADERNLKPYEKQIKEDSIVTARKAKAIGQHVLGDDALAKLFYQTSHHPKPWYHTDNMQGNGFQITNTPCSLYERLYFHHLPVETQTKIRTAFHKQLGSPLIQPHDPRIDTLLFASKTHFDSACRSTLGKEAVEQLNQTATHLTGLNSSARGAQRVFDERLGKKEGREKNIIRTNVAIEMAMEKDTGVLGGRWSRLQEYTEISNADHAVPPPSTLQERVHFHTLSPSQQNDIRTRLFHTRANHTQQTLTDLKIDTEEKLSTQTGGKYTQYAQLVSDDMLFRDRTAYREAAVHYLP